MKHKDAVDVFLGAVACVLLALSLKFACLPSKDALFLGLYSLPKFTLILVCGVSSLLLISIKDQLISFVSVMFLKIRSEIAEPKISNSHNRHLLSIFLSLVGTYLLSLFFLPSIQGDFVIQYFAYSQYLQDISSAIDNQKLVTVQDDELVIIEKKIKLFDRLIRSK